MMLGIDMLQIVHLIHRTSHKQCKLLVHLLLLCCITLQSPVPYLHCHSSNGNTNRIPEAWLAEHLLECHCPLSAAEHARMGWHLHWYFPEKPSDPSPADQHPVSLQILASAVTYTQSIQNVPDASWTQTPLMVVWQLPLFVPSNPQASQFVSNEFYTSFATSLARPVRFGVILA
jgi:hypothetical protein